MRSSLLPWKPHRTLRGRRLGVPLHRLVLLLSLVCSTACGPSDVSEDLGNAADSGTQVTADSGATSPLQDAIRHLRSGQADQAQEVLETFVEAQPEVARAWSLLGQVRKQSGDLDGAQAAWQRALELDPDDGRVRYGLSAVYALQSNTGAALEGLEALRALNTTDLSQLPLDPDFSGLLEHPRFVALQPRAEDFETPFVEPTRILHVWDGEAAQDQYGWIARNIGDVDGDGIADITTSAPTKTLDGQANSGRVYAYSGASGQLLWSRDGRPGDFLGQGIEAAGDVNGDGIPDVAAGAPGGDRVDVYSGRDGTTVLSVDGNEGEQFGGKVSDIGDLNGDGHGDILVGAPGSNANGQGSGRAVVLSGQDGAVLIEWQGESAGHRFGASGAGSVGTGDHAEHTFILVGAPDAGDAQKGRTYVYRGLEERPSFVLDSDPEGNEQGGMFVSVVGDVNADGTPDLYSSDWAFGRNEDGTPSRRGRIYVYSGVDGSRLHTLTGEADGDGFGIGPADAGDVNGDGHDDLVIGAWQHGSAAPSGGKVYLYSGRDGSLLDTWTGQVMGDTFGFDATGMGDVDGDGKIDFLLTSAWSAVSGPKSGRMFLIAGN